MQRSQGIKFAVLVLLLVIALPASLFWGGAGSLDLQTESGRFIFTEIRFPKTVTALLAGTSLSVAGLVLQVLFRNPLAGPYVLGISSGAALIVAAGLLAGSSMGIIHDHLAGRALMVAAAVTGGLVVTLMILAVSKKVSNNVVLLLIGLMFSQVCSAIQSSLEFFADPGSLKNFVIWGMGSLSGTTNTDLLVYLPVTIIFLAALFFFIKPLNALLLGQDYASSLGISFNRSRFFLILISSVLTGITTAFCGPIAFIGIAVPILSRMIFKSSSQQLHVVSCILLGSILLLFADVISHAAVRGTSLPVNMITTLIGAPLVITLMFRYKQW